MAIGNMFQGMARGKVGDVVFAVREGKQVSRVRNRKPKNPQTNKQIMQRAIMATVLQAYSAGKEIFDHSFQGKSVGEQCAREFLSLNAKALRAAIAAEVNVDLKKQKNVVVLPKATKPVANEYVISQGTYEQSFFVLENDNMLINFPEPEENETPAAYYQRCGLVPGDLYTIIVFAGPKDNANFVVSGYNIASDFFATNAAEASFGYIRFQVKPLSSVSSVATLLGFMEITKSKIIPPIAGMMNIIETVEGGNGMLVLDTMGDVGSVGIIRSRLDADLRSNTVMKHCSADNMSQGVWNRAGIVGGLAVQAWKQRTAQLGESDLILEGGDV